MNAERNGIAIDCAPFCKPSSVPSADKRCLDESAGQPTVKQCIIMCGFPETQQVSLLGLTRSSGSDTNCFRIAVLSLAHREQLFDVTALTAPMGLPCQRLPHMELSLGCLKRELHQGIGL